MNTTQLGLVRFARLQPWIRLSDSTLAVAEELKCKVMYIYPSHKKAILSAAASRLLLGDS